MLPLKQYAFSNALWEGLGDVLSVFGQCLHLVCVLVRAQDLFPLYRFGSESGRCFQGSHCSSRSLFGSASSLLLVDTGRIRVPVVGADSPRHSSEFMVPHQEHFHCESEPILFLSRSFSSLDVLIAGATSVRHVCIVGFLGRRHIITPSVLDSVFPACALLILVIMLVMAKILSRRSGGAIGCAAVPLSGTCQLAC